MDKNAVKLYFEKKVFYTQTELIKDFLLSLVDKVERTYLGDEIMTIDNKKDHFNWCINETIKLFTKEEIYFNSSRVFQEKLFDVFNKFYYNLKKNKTTLEDIKYRFMNTLNASQAKTTNQIEELVWYCSLFNSHLGAKSL
jgi:hypothetical protein